MKTVNTPVPVGEYLGLKMAVTFEPFFKKFTLTLKGGMSHSVDIGSDPSGNITRINNELESMGKQLEETMTQLSNAEHQLETAKEEVQKPFPQEAELSEKLEKLAELNALLNMDEKGDDAADVDDGAKQGISERQAEPAMLYPVENARIKYAVSEPQPGYGPAMQKNQKNRRCQKKRWQAA